MASIRNLKPGQVLYTISRRKMGNTTISTTVVHPVEVVRVAEDGRSVVAVWNSNRERTYYERDVTKWRVQRPLLIRQGVGSYRLATKAEHAAHQPTKEHP